MPGHDIGQIPCTYCHRNASDIDAVWDEGLPYHEPCYKLSLSNELKQYQKKVSLGTITLNESNRMSELQTTINLIRDSDKRPTISNHKPKSKLIARSGVPVFFTEDRRMKAIEDNKISKERSLLIQSKIDEDKNCFGNDIADKLLSGKIMNENNNNTTISTGDLPKIEGRGIA